MAEYLISELEVPEVGKTLIFKDKEARDDLSTAVVETSASNPLTFTTRSAQNAQSAEIVLEPIQDLHGYDHPWPAGGGKNQLPMTVEGIKALNTGGTWNGDVYTYNGVTFAIQTDDGKNVTGVLVNGTNTASSIISCRLGFSEPITGNVIATGCPSGGSSNSYSLRIGKGDDDAYVGVETGTGAEYSFDNEKCSARIHVASGYTATNLLFKPMIRLATETDPTFAPYSNICPISGHTEVSVGGCGKNRLPLLIDEIKTYNVRGTWSGNTYTYNGVKFICTVDSNGNIININADGTASGDTASFTLIRSDTDLLEKLKTSRCILNGSPVGGSSNTYGMQFWSSGAGNYFDSGNGVTITIADDYSGIYNISIYVINGVSVSNKAFKPMIRLATESDPTFEPYTPSNELTKDLGQEVFGGSYNPVSGKLVVTWGIVDLGTPHWIYDTTALSVPVFRTSISNKAAGSFKMICSKYMVLNGDRGLLKNNNNSIAPWNTSTSTTIGVRDDSYTDVNTFEQAMQGVQLCYELATPITYHLTPDEIKLLSGVNTVWTDGTSIKIAYRDGKVATLADLQNTADNLQEQIDQNETMEDETTQLLYKLGVNNGLLFIEEV